MDGGSGTERVVSNLYSVNWGPFVISAPPMTTTDHILLNTENRLLAPRLLLPPSLDSDSFDSCFVVGTESHHLGIILQRIVYDSPVIGIHWLELYRPA